MNPSTEKTREARFAVRQSLRERRRKVKQLRQGMKEGRDLSEDMDICLGEIELLKKEMKSIEEGGHPTFLEARDLISPKKDFAAKKSKLKEELERLQKEIKHFEARLTMPNLTDNERSRMSGEISVKNDASKELEEEMEALHNFDHTRFVEAREQRRRSVKLELALEKVESRKEELTEQMLEALERADEPLIIQLQEKIILAEQEREKLLNSEGDDLLRE